MASVNLSFEGVGPLREYDYSLPGIILLHGMTSSQLTWKDLRRPIANATGRKVFTYDARNHGDSGWSDDFSYDSMANDLKNIMNNLHMPKVILVGHSMGGKVAMRFALNWPEKVEKLIIEDISPKPRPPGDRRYIHVYIELLRQSLEAIPPEEKSLQKAKEIIAQFIHDKIPSNHRSEKHALLPPQELPLKVGEDGKFQWKANLDVIQDSIINAFPATSYDGKFDGPSLFLYGTKSAYNVIKEKDYIAERFPGAAFSAIEGGGHSLHIEYPEEFTQKTVDFIKNV